MKSNFRKVLFTFLLMGVLPAVAGSCDVLFYDAHAQTAGQTCLIDNVLAPWAATERCFNRLAKQNAGEELPVPVSENKCMEQLLITYIMYKNNCEDK